MTCVFHGSSRVKSVAQVVETLVKSTRSALNAHATHVLIEARLSQVEDARDQENCCDNVHVMDVRNASRAAKVNQCSWRTLV